MSSCENRNIHWNRSGVGLIQSNAKISFTTQKKKNEYTDVHKTNATLKCNDKMIIMIRLTNRKDFFDVLTIVILL